tara:strand:+ start:137 stop:271 length:135 start_codon:yes stop_codon:yes gene_type:complete
MKARPNRDNFPNGCYGDCDYEEEVEKYIDYLLRYYIKPNQTKDD